jgi:uncharacterized caspase-like protein
MLRRVFLVVVLLIGYALPALAEKRVALILAAEKYTLIRPLGNPDNDARAIEDLLEKLDFEVFTETDRDLRRMRRALEDFKEDAAGADVALLFYAGHGVALDGVNYLLPTDADASSAETLVKTALPLSEAQEVLKAVAPVAIVLLDACRDDPFNGGGTEGRGAAALDGATPAPKGVPVPGLGRIGRADGVLFAFAAAPNETASDGDEANSPFTAALVRHFGTAGVELRTALTLVQQDVYDRSRGKQLPYIESGLPELVFITGQGVLPERDQLLIAMADLTPELRNEVEALAAERDLPLAPLYAALLSGDLAGQTPEERARLLMEAATSYEAFQSELLRFQSDDPRVADLRVRAEEQLTLGAFDAARALLTEAAEIDAQARGSIRETFIARTLSEAATHTLNANAARTDLRYDLAISDLTKAVALFAELKDEDLERQAKFDYSLALSNLGDLQLVAGNTNGALDAFTTRSQFIQAQVEADPMDVAWVRELIWSLNSVGFVLQQQGYLKQAETAYASALEFSQWQADQMPDNIDLMRDRQIAQNKLGEIRFAQNDLPGALQAHQDAEALGDKILATDPQSTTLRRDFAYTKERLGDVLLAMGNKEVARVAYATSLATTKALATEFPGEINYQADLSTAYERLGDILLTDRDYAASLDAFSKSLEIREKLAALDPDNKLRQRELSVNFEKIGDVNSGLGDLDSALLAYQAAMSLREKLAAIDPTNMAWQRDLSIALERIGDTYARQNDLASALKTHERCLAVREGIVALDPENLPPQRDLGVALENVGEVKFSMGDVAGAMEVYRRALELRRAMSQANPSVLQYKRDLTISLIKLADTQMSQNNLAEAEPLMAEAVALREDMIGATPDEINQLRDLSYVQMQHSEMLRNLGRVDEALAVGQAALKTVDRVLQLAPGDAENIHDRLVTLNRIGDALVVKEDEASAVDYYREMTAMGSRLLEIDAFNTGWASDLAVGLERLGNAQEAVGDVEGALKSHQDCLALRDWLVQQDGTNVTWYNNLSISYQRVATLLGASGDLQGALDHQEMSVTIMRDLVGAYPDDVWYKLDLVRALDTKATYLQDPTAVNQEALAILEDMNAAGTLPPDYVDWIPAFRRVLGLPTDF